MYIFAIILLGVSMKSFILIILTLTLSLNVLALESETIKLRVTKEQDQLYSQYCWVFSTLTMLETMFLEENPNVAADDIKLSRWYFKESTRSIYTQGAILDAVNYHMEQIGLVSASDYNDTSEYPAQDGSGIITETTFLGETMSPFALKDKLVGDRVFWSYAISETLKGWHAHPDTTTRAGNVAYFVPRAEIAGIIKRSLDQRAPIAFWYQTHVVVIYGATYDEDGNPTKYFIKDSYKPYFLEKNPEWVHSEIITLTGLAHLE